MICVPRCAVLRTKHFSGCTAEAERTAPGYLGPCECHSTCAMPRSWPQPGATRAAALQRQMFVGSKRATRRLAHSASAWRPPVTRCGCCPTAASMMPLTGPLSRSCAGKDIRRTMSLPVLVVWRAKWPPASLRATARGLPYVELQLEVDWFGLCCGMWMEQRRCGTETPNVRHSQSC
jgi:hypothetical protein